MGTLVCLPFVLVCLGTASFAWWRSRQVRTRAGELRASLGASSAGAPPRSLGDFTVVRPGCSGAASAVTALVQLARAAEVARQRVAAFDELAGHYDLCRAQTGLEEASFRRLPILAGTAGGILAVLAGLPQPSATDFGVAVACWAGGGLSLAFVVFQATRRRRALKDWRRDLGVLRRELDSRTTTG